MSDIIDRRSDSKGKSSPNRKRFIKRIKGHIKKAMPDLVNNQSIKDFGKGGKGVRVPVKGINEPKLRNDPSGGNQDRVLPGNDRFSPGDKARKPQGGGCGGCGSGKKGGVSDSGESVDEFIVNISHDEFREFFFEGLELPNMIQKVMNPSTEEFRLRPAGHTKSGPPPRLNIIRTYRNALGRNIGVKFALEEDIKELEEKKKKLEEQIECSDCEEEIKKLNLEIEEIEEQLKALNELDIPFIDDVDLRYDNYVLEPVPITNAVMFCLMDVSASMMELEKEIAKRFFMLLYSFLEGQYKNVEIVFIRHHHEAKEVDEEEFFESRESGGTVVSTALDLMHKIRRERYPLNQWNVYVSQATDGDNFYHDMEHCVDVLNNKIMPEIQYYAYIQINSYSEENLWTIFRKVAESNPHFQMRHIKRINEIWQVFKDLFKKAGGDD